MCSLRRAILDQHQEGGWLDPPTLASNTQTLTFPLHQGKTSLAQMIATPSLIPLIVPPLGLH